jgi:uncharacterized protein YecT (DUF1311 family)
MEKATSQSLMTACASDEARLADTELNSVFQALLSAARSQQRAVENIRNAERSWIVYRDAYVDAVYPASNKQEAYGSSFAMEVDLLRARLSYRQIDAIKGLMAKYSGTEGMGREPSH